MKLYEFVDRLYAMGDMESLETIESKRTLNESYGDTIETNKYKIRGYNPSNGEIDTRDFLIVDKDMHQMYYYADLLKLIRRMGKQYDFEVSGEGFQKVIHMLLDELIQPDAEYIRDLIVYFLSEVHDEDVELVEGKSFVKRGRKPTDKLTYDEVEEAEKVLKDAGFKKFSIDGYGVDPGFNEDSKEIAKVLNAAGFACRLETKKEQEEANRPRKFVFFKTKKRDVNEGLNESLNEDIAEDLNDIISVTVDFNSDEDDIEVINYIKQKYNIDVIDYDPTEYIENATLRGTKSNLIKYLATEYQGYDSEEEGIDWVKEFYPELFDESLTEALKPEELVPGEVYSHKTIPYMDKDEAEEYPEEFEAVKAALVLRSGVYCVPRRYELKYVGIEEQTPGWNPILVFDVMGTEISFDRDILNYLEPADKELTEARNPENEEVNAVLRKWANSDRNRISKHDQKVLDDAGIALRTDKYDAPHKYAVHKNNEGDIIDLHRMDKYRIKNAHPDHDLANDLATTGRHWSNRNRYNKNKDPRFPWRDAEYRSETPEESDALRPYSDKYKSLKRAVDDTEGYPYWHAGAEQELDDFKASVPKRNK